MLLSDGHHSCIDDTELERGEARVDLCRTTKKSRREEHRGVLSSRDSGEEESRCVRRDPCAQKLVDLDEHEIGNDELAPQLRHESGSQSVRAVTTIRGGDERPRVGDDPQRASTSSRR